jgi:two-component system, cell cycle response regulator
LATKSTVGESAAEEPRLDPSDSAVAVLLVEDNPVDAHLVCSLLNGCELDGEVEVVESLAGATTRLGERAFDIVLLDLLLPDARGLESLHHVRVLAPEAAVVVLTGREEDVALQAVRDGAQDYLRKHQLDGDALCRAVRYGVERNRLLGQIRAMSLRDELTGLYNRRGFFTLAEQQVRMATRTGRGMGIVYIDIDGLKAINDGLGHLAGDRAIREAADLIRETFRNSDIVARLGGDEFVVLALETDADGIEIALHRLDERLLDHNAEPGRDFTLAMSTGVTLFDPEAPVAVEELLTRADGAMYSRKRAKPGAGRQDPRGR